MSNESCSCLALVCEAQGYLPARAPKSDCPQAWALYNDHHDLPEGNRLPKSKVKGAWLTRRLPRFELYELPAGRFQDTLPGALEGFEPSVLGIDASLRNTGVCVLARSLSGDFYRVVPLHYGISLSQAASPELTVIRMTNITNTVANIFSACQPYGLPDIVIEDHAFARNDNKATALHELHGDIKGFFWRTRNRLALPVGIASVRSVIAHNGSLKKDKFHALLKAKLPWLNKLTEDEIDAWAVATAHLIEVNHGD